MFSDEITNNGETAINNGISLQHLNDVISPMNHIQDIADSEKDYHLNESFTHSIDSKFLRPPSVGSRYESVDRILRNSIVQEEEVKVNLIPNMWSKHYIGLYSQYAAIGLLNGTAGALYSLCIYSYDGAPNVCANAQSITFFPWSFKIIFAVITDVNRPFGLRRKPWMIFGWAIVLILLLVLALFSHNLDVSTWLIMLMLIQFFSMFSDVPADGYSVELGQLEPKESRGVILATGQMIRFISSIFAGCIQAFFLNGPSTNEAGCEISFQGCWSFGLSTNGYYALLFAVIFVLSLPIIWLKELDPSRIPQHSFTHFMSELWSTLQNLTTLYLLIFVIGGGGLTNFGMTINVYMQYYIIKLTNFQAGIDTITTYIALSVAIWIFKTFLINKNWRTTQYSSTFLASSLGMLWLLVYYNIGGLQNPWFTIFVDLDQTFAQGITQVLFSLAVIELSRPGLEATTYELLITVGNGARTLNTIFATQMLTPLDTASCTDDDGTCPPHTVRITSPDGFTESNGPFRFTVYAVVMTSISLGCCLIFIPFLPSGKDQCHEWKQKGELAGNSVTRGYIATMMCVIIIFYGFTVAILLLIPTTSCLQLVGGSGC